MEYRERFVSLLTNGQNKRKIKSQNGIFFTAFFWHCLECVSLKNLFIYYLFLNLFNVLILTIILKN